MRISSWLVLGLAIAGVSSAGAVSQGDAAPPWVGQELTNGAEVRFPEVLNGQPAVLVFWATWCPYCKAFMPYAVQIQKDYAELGVQLITFNAKERGRGDPKAYVASLGAPMVSIAAADDIAQRYDVQFIPGLMVVDGSGQVIYRRASTNLPAGRTVAQQWSEEVRASLDKLLAEQSPAL